MKAEKVFAPRALKVSCLLVLISFSLDLMFIFQPSPNFLSLLCTPPVSLANDIITICLLGRPGRRGYISLERYVLPDYLSITH